MRNRIFAALLAFFVGWFGIHKFYLGENIVGILFLIFSWTFIPGILAFIDFLGLLLMSDQDFDNRYNRGHRSPFLPVNKYESSREKALTLGELKKLYDNDIITAEEYEQKRRKILDEI